MTSPSRALRASLLAFALASLGAVASAQTPTHERLTRIAHAYIDAIAGDDPMRATTLGIAGRDGELVIPCEARAPRAIARLRAWVPSSMRSRPRPARRSRWSMRTTPGCCARRSTPASTACWCARPTARTTLARPGGWWTCSHAVPAPAHPRPRRCHRRRRRPRPGPTSRRASRRARPTSRRARSSSPIRAGCTARRRRASRRRARLPQRSLPLRPRTSWPAIPPRSGASWWPRPRCWRRWSTPARHRGPRRCLARQLRDRQGGLRADAAARATAAVRPATSSGMARDELAHGWAEEAWLKLLDASQAGLRRRQRRRHGAQRAGPDRLLPRADRRAAHVHARPRAHHDPGLAGLDGRRRDAQVPAAGVAGRLDGVAAPVREVGPRLLLHHAAGVAQGGGRAPGHERGLRPRPHLSTAAHEAMPGHFLQLSIARRHSDYVRKIQCSGVFAEGWAFYGEEMFVRLGLYGDDLDARLFTARWERVRGARAIVDGEAGQRRMDAGAGGRVLRGAVRLHQVGVGGRGRRLRAAARATSSPTRWGACSSRNCWRNTSTAWAIGAHCTTSTTACCRTADTVRDRGPELLADLDKPASAVRAVGQLLSGRAATGRARGHLPRRCAGASRRRASADSVSVIAR